MTPLMNQMEIGQLRIWLIIFKLESQPLQYHKPKLDSQLLKQLIIIKDQASGFMITVRQFFINQRIKNGQASE
jgi:hypothetical protein